MTTAKKQYVLNDFMDSSGVQFKISVSKDLIIAYFVFILPNY